MPHIDLTITLGNLIEMGVIAGTLFGLYAKFIGQFSSLKTTLENHGEQLERHADRMEKYEAGMFQIVGQVQRVMGRLDGFNPPRRSSS